MSKHIAIYIRVSTAQQSTRSQVPDLERYVQAQDETLPVKWYTDKATGKNMDRPQWKQIQTAIDAGQVSKLVVWRLDRLGRTASGLCKLFEDLIARKVRLVSLKDSIDLGTPSGRLIAHVLASVAAYETEVRGERVRAGQAASRAAGKRWGGSRKGWRHKVNDQQVAAILKMKVDGEKVTKIAKTVSVTRGTVYRIVRYHQQGLIAE